MLEDLEFDDSDSPAIGLVPPGVSWDEVRDHIKIAHPVCWCPRPTAINYAGTYWTGTEMAVVEDLGPDQDQASTGIRCCSGRVTRIRSPRQSAAPPRRIWSGPGRTPSRAGACAGAIRRGRAGRMRRSRPVTGRPCLPEPDGGRLRRRRTGSGRTTGRTPGSTGSPADCPPGSPGTCRASRS
jgi:hypothetical protein